MYPHLKRLRIVLSDGAFFFINHLRKWRKASIVDKETKRRLNQFITLSNRRTHEYDKQEVYV